ncbi:MAG: alpha/beta hydrolase [Candidatus Thorarchaeota archaeon]
MPGCEPIFKQNSDTGCLLLHGFTSCPFELRQLGDQLYNEGYTVSIPLLPGHGTAPQDLKRQSWTDWYEASKQALFELRKMCQTVYVIGLSMGGSIALHLAAHYEVEGIVALAPGLYLKNKLSFLSHVLYPFYPYSKKWFGPDIRADVETITYDKIPVKSLSELLRLFRHLKDDLTDINAPLLIIYAKQDHVINGKSAQEIYQRISSKNKRILSLQNSYHIITLDLEKDQVFRETINFLRGLK